MTEPELTEIEKLIDLFGDDDDPRIAAREMFADEPLEDYLVDREMDRYERHHLGW